MMPLPSPTFWPTMARAVLGRCPKCGKGKLFAGYLKQVEQCAVCGERFGHIRADDGPAWLTILVVGHILATLILAIAPNTDWPDWMGTLIWCTVALALILVILPRSKGLFIAIIWRSGCLGTGK